MSKRPADASAASSSSASAMNPAAAAAAAASAPPAHSFLSLIPHTVADDAAASAISVAPGLANDDADTIEEADEVESHAGAGVAVRAASAAAPVAKSKKSKAPPRGHPGENRKLAKGEDVSVTQAEVAAQTARLTQAMLQLKVRRAQSKGAPADLARDPIILSIHAEKGGVGKTTTSLALAYALADAGERVLLIDCDGQRSLTAFALSGQLAEGQTLTEFIARDLSATAPNLHELPRSLFEQMHAVYTSAVYFPGILRPAVSYNLSNNVYLVPGNRQMSKLDTQITTQQALAHAGQIPADMVSGLGYHAVLETARSVQASFVVLDLNPNAGSFNHTMIMSSHYLITPCIADFFSSEIVEQTTEQLREWRTLMEQVRPRTAVGNAPFALPVRLVQYMGYILNRFTARMHGPIVNGVSTEVMSHNEQLWADRVQQLCVQSMTALATEVPPLSVPLARHTAIQRTCCLGRTHDFGNLGDLSSVFHLPVNQLRFEHLVTIRNGVVGPMMQLHRSDLWQAIQWWKLVYLHMAATIVNLCE